jgi:hypothetical protein
MWKSDMNSLEAAAVIERFLQSKSLYPQEWNDFVDTPQKRIEVENIRRRCYELDPLVNRPGSSDPIALAELESIASTLQTKRD